MSQDIKTVDTASDWLVAEFSYGNLELHEEIYSQVRKPAIVAENILR